jgi:hypothetical protein
MTTGTCVSPTVSKVFRRNGVAGQFAIQCTVDYPGEEPRVVEFVGSTYGGPVLMVTESGHTWVTDPGRFGSFGRGWVRRFFA